MNCTCSRKPPCINAESCRNYLIRKEIILDEEVVAMAMYKVLKGGRVTYVQWGDKELLEQALTAMK